MMACRDKNGRFASCEKQNPLEGFIRYKRSVKQALINDHGWHPREASVIIEENERDIRNLYFDEVTIATAADYVDSPRFIRRGH